MEIILAATVVAAVIVFGALISVGNERQRRAIDNLREQITLWALQDLRTKRERLAHEINIEDPLQWLNNLVAKISGYDMRLQVEEAIDKPAALICISNTSGKKVIFSPLSTGELHHLQSGKGSRLDQYSAINQLVTIPRGTSIQEITLLNAGILFDLELPLAWNSLTNHHVAQMDRVWMYEFP